MSSSARWSVPMSTYTHLARSAVAATVLELPLRFCSLEDLRAMKEAAGRPRDLDDLKNLPPA